MHSGRDLKIIRGKPVSVRLRSPTPGLSTRHRGCARYMPPLQQMKDEHEFLLPTCVADFKYRCNGRLLFVVPFNRPRSRHAQTNLKSTLLLSESLPPQVSKGPNQARVGPCQDGTISMGDLCLVRSFDCRGGRVFMRSRAAGHMGGMNGAHPSMAIIPR